MAKKKKADVLPEEKKDIMIVSATLNDGLCKYSYQVLDGVCSGDEHTVKGKGLYDDDLGEAMRQLNVHLALIDDVFLHSEIEFDHVEGLINHELTANYNVTGFKTNGEGDDQSVILMGTKSISSASGTIGLQTPKVLLSEHSSYKWWEELKHVINHCKM